MPLRVSAVPPDLEMTRTSVCFRRPPRVEDVVDAVGIGVVEEGDGHLVAVALEPAEGVADELRPEGRAADADDEDFLELGAARGR
jgi:hypothetical protein